MIRRGFVAWSCLTVVSVERSPSTASGTLIMYVFWKINFLGLLFEKSNTTYDTVEDHNSSAKDAAIVQELDIDDVDADDTSVDALGNSGIEDPSEDVAPDTDLLTHIPVQNRTYDMELMSKKVTSREQR